MCVLVLSPCAIASVCLLLDVCAYITCKQKVNKMLKIRTEICPREETILGN